MSRNETDVLKRPPATVPPASAEPKQLPLFSAEALKAVDGDEARWRRDTLEPLTARKAAWKKDFTTVSGMEVNPLATPNDIAFPAHSGRICGRCDRRYRSRGSRSVAAATPACRTSSAAGRRGRPRGP